MLQNICVAVYNVHISYMYVYDRRIINDTCIYIYIESIFLLYTHILAYRPIEAIVRVPCWAPQLYLQAKTPEEQLAQEAAVPGASTRRSPSPPPLGHAARARPRPRGAAWAGSASYSRPRGGSVVEGGSPRAKGFSPPQGVSRPQGRSLLRGGSPSRREALLRGAVLLHRPALGRVRGAGLLFLPQLRLGSLCALTCVHIHLRLLLRGVVLRGRCRRWRSVCCCSASVSRQPICRRCARRAQPLRRAGRLASPPATATAARATAGTATLYTEG